jgi:penicillin-binding protein 1C
LRVTFGSDRREMNNSEARGKYLKIVFPAVLLVVLLVMYLSCLPGKLFDDPLCTVIDDRHGNLLGARIAADGQWRFPPGEEVPPVFREALLVFEDRYFYYHPGFNPVSMARALAVNIRERRIVSGASTITQQVIRLSRKGRPRSLMEKMTELILATRLEMNYSKDEILALYAFNAPFGGNVVGLDAAAWRYFGRNASQLSRAEAASLAVLPNSPSLVFPGRNEKIFLEKRDRLLRIMHARGLFDSLTLDLALKEPLPGRPYPLPRPAPHLVDRMQAENQGKRVRTTIDPWLQENAVHILENHQQTLRASGIHNSAALIIETGTGRVVAYVGNTSAGDQGMHGQDVDIITSPRSTGSILKPFLFAYMTHEGLILPEMLVPDIPARISGYSPKNFTNSYDGAVPASRSLSRSLNIPSVMMLRDYGVENFHYRLGQSGMTTLRFPPHHYGLSLVLGGAEGTLWDLAGMYASFSRLLLDNDPGPARSADMQYSQPVLVVLPEGKKNPATPAGHLPLPVDAASVWLTWEALIRANRPDEHAAWEITGSRKRIAWKTGTSFGNRDAWAIGTTPEYVVAVWAGNASGEGRAGLTGISAAAPLMFRLFDMLPSNASWFAMPYTGMVQAEVCSHSGYRAGIHCSDKEEAWIHYRGLESSACPWHRLVHTDRSGNYRVSASCEPVSNIVSRSWFVLPPVMEWYYRRRNPSYRELPPFRPGCGDPVISMMDLVYPDQGTTIFVPRGFDGEPGKAVFELAHRNPEAVVFWHLDGEYIGTTTGIHQVEVSPGPGSHFLTLVDMDGNRLERVFEVAGE